MSFFAGFESGLLNMIDLMSWILKSYRFYYTSNKVFIRLHLVRWPCKDECYDLKKEFKDKNFT